MTKTLKEELIQFAANKMIEVNNDRIANGHVNKKGLEGLNQILSDTESLDIVIKELEDNMVEFKLRNKLDIQAIKISKLEVANYLIGRLV